MKGVFLLFGLSLATLAQAQPPTDVEVIQVTASRQALGASQVAQGVTVIDPGEIARQTPQVVTDLLRGQAGVFVQQTTPGQGIAIVRGLKGSEVLHLVDGIRLNHAFFRNAPNQYLALVDPQTLDQIEVVRGPASALYGSDAMGGVVNLITHQPEFAGQSWRHRGALRLSASSAERATRSRLELAGGNRRLALGAGLSYQDAQDRRTGGGERLRPTAYSASAGNAFIRFAPGPSSEWRLDIARLRQPSTPRYDQLVPGFGEDEARRAEFSFAPSERRFAHLRGRVETPFAVADELTVHLAQQRLTDDSRRRDLGSDQRDLEENRSQLTAFVAEAISELGPSHTLRYGMEVYDDHVSSRRERVDLATGQTSPRASRFPDGATMRSQAIYAQHDGQVGDSSQLILGLRASRIDIELPADAQRPAASLALEDLSGNLGWRQRLAPGWFLAANAGRAFRSPNVFDLGALGPRPGNRFNQPNPGLGPERLWSYDLGIKTRHRRYYAELFVFYADYRDKIVSVFTGEQTDAGEDIVRSENLNRVRLWGSEAAWRLRPTATVEISGSLNWVWGEERDADGATQPADRIPPINGRLAIRVSPAGPLDYEAWLQIADRQDRLSERDAADSRIAPGGTPGYSTVNLRLGWQARRNLRLNLALHNLLDENYREHGSGLDAPGRDLSLSLAWEF